MLAHRLCSPCYGAGCKARVGALGHEYLRALFFAEASFGRGSPGSADGYICDAMQLAQVCEVHKVRIILICANLYMLTILNSIFSLVV